MTVSNVDYAGTGNDDGTVFGKSDSKIGFHGLTTPIVKPTVVATVSTTTTVGDISVLQTALDNLVTGLQATGLFV